jgi:hypothetical protein
MFARALLLAAGAAILLSARAAGAGPEAPRERDESAAPQPVRRVDPGADRPFRWGIPESPFPLLEEERKLFGFHFHFEFGRGEPPRRGPRVR